VFRSPRLESGQLDRAAGLIANDHLFPAKALDRLPVRGPRLLACGRVLLSSTARLFFRISSQRVNARLIVLRLTRTCTDSASFSPRSAKAAAGCWRWNRSTSAKCLSTFPAFPPPYGLGSTLPVCRDRCGSSCTKLRLTLKSRA